MTCIPKPARRGRKPRRPIRRSAQVASRSKRWPEMARLDAEWSRAILEIHPHCRCGCGRPSTDAHHIIPKSLSRRTRHRLRNGLALWHECHMRVHRDGEFRELLYRQCGVDLPYLRRLAGITKGDMGMIEDAARHAQDHEDARRLLLEYGAGAFPPFAATAFMVRMLIADVASMTASRDYWREQVIAAGEADEQAALRAAREAKRGR